MALKNVVEHTIGVFKNYFWYFEASRHSLPLSTQVDIVYTLTIIYNFINLNNLDNLGYFLEVQNEIINKKKHKARKGRK